MTLEDYMKELRVDPSRDVRPMEAPKMQPLVSPTTPDIKAAADTAPKLETEDVDRLANTFSTQPKAPQEPYQNESLKAYDTIIEQMKKVKPEATWGDFLMGLIPVGLDLATGRTGGGTRVAADYYTKKAQEVEKQKATLESRIADLQKAKLLEMAREPKTLEVVGSKGEPIITPVTKAIGKEAWKKPEELRLGDGKQERFEAAQKQKKEFADRALKFQAKKELMADKEFIKQRNRYTATNDAIDILNKKSWAGDQGIGFLFARGIFGEVGSLTNEERTAFIANPAIWNKVDFYINKYIEEGSGTFSEDDRKELIKLSKAMRERAKNLSSSIAGGYIEGYKSEGIDPSNVIRPILQYKDVPSIYDVKKPSFNEWKKSKGY